ncbi:CDP-diacylglycerol--serine O-phosphatidyltransferase [Alkalihalobacillus trypoxylicola]|uniref:CDP-diacylglycerol--serine O-phosphatidyltransferase n=1 Tax=Alkalihalobacillus trypoxylicola TaxID=519424 RepID=A0A162E7T7_9BACI|nr:CDP-diacylglycerol--serine O-phosphatidyltransferase [Alkalihalobacillus trypoxylicola]KYG31989.1 phosphatidylserine synthase [Alkalihalobacillus trypoxylicola]GAF66009.1 phosphatidylserine synthase [Bacillus sp. TS-2]
MFLLQRLDNTRKKLKGQIANVLTLLNLTLGAFAILYTIQSELTLALLFIAIAAVFDRLDGAVARKFNATSDIGKQLDSLSDIISFGVAPALLIHEAVLVEFGFAGAFFAIVFIICGAIRLAKFNVSESTCYFVGVPITLAGCILTFTSLFVGFLPEFLFMFICLFLALSMISPLKIKKM